LSNLFTLRQIGVSSKTEYDHARGRYVLSPNANFSVWKERLLLRRLHPRKRRLRLQNVQPSNSRVTNAPHPSDSRPHNDGLNDPCVGAQLAAVFQTQGNSLAQELCDRLQRLRGEPDERSIECEWVINGGSTKTLPHRIVAVTLDIKGLTGCACQMQ
jgi:hypothetical protein